MFHPNLHWEAHPLWGCACVCFGLSDLAQHSESYVASAASHIQVLHARERLQLRHEPAMQPPGAPVLFKCTTRWVEMHPSLAMHLPASAKSIDDVGHYCIQHSAHFPYNEWADTGVHQVHLSFHKRCTPADMRSFIRSYDDATLLNTPPTLPALSAAGTSWNPATVVWWDSALVYPRTDRYHEYQQSAVILRTAF